VLPITPPGNKKPSIINHKLLVTETVLYRPGLALSEA
jgi:hypothetical protein